MHRFHPESQEILCKKKLFSVDFNDTKVNRLHLFFFTSRFERIPNKVFLSTLRNNDRWDEKYFYAESISPDLSVVLR